MLSYTCYSANPLFLFSLERPEFANTKGMWIKKMEVDSNTMKTTIKEKKAKILQKIPADG